MCGLAYWISRFLGSIITQRPRHRKDSCTSPVPFTNDTTSRGSGFAEIVHKDMSPKSELFEESPGCYPLSGTGPTAKELDAAIDQMVLDY